MATVDINGTDDASYLKIDYTLRPAKHTERKMLCEAFRRLWPFAPVPSYRYVGFGSVYFTDFRLFHRALGWTNMLCIEKVERDRPRFKFNRPYRCIRNRFGHSNEELPQLDWSPPTVLWLDYDHPLSKADLADVRWFCDVGSSGSVLVVTTEVDPRKYLDRSIRDELADRLGEELLPLGLENADLHEWGLARAARQVLLETIHISVEDRNALLSSGDRMSFHKLFDFRYSDGTRMLTVGGILVKQAHCGKFKECGFDQLGFVRSGRSGEEDFHLDLPRLTLREMRFLDQHLPGSLKAKDIDPIPLEEAEKYAQIYKYFPLFSETDL